MHEQAQPLDTYWTSRALALDGLAQTTTEAVMSMSSITELSASDIWLTRALHVGAMALVMVKAMAEQKVADDVDGSLESANRWIEDRKYRESVMARAYDDPAFIATFKVAAEARRVWNFWAQTWEELGSNEKHALMADWAQLQPKVRERLASLH